MAEIKNIDIWAIILSVMNFFGSFCLAEIIRENMWHKLMHVSFDIYLDQNLANYIFLYLLNRYFSYRQIRSVRHGHSAPIEKAEQNICNSIA